MEDSQVQRGKVYLANDHGRRRRVRVIGRSAEHPGTWVCQDLEREDTFHFRAEQLSTANTAGGGRPP
jgi:hypothetical protein